MSYKDTKARLNAALSDAKAHARRHLTGAHCGAHTRVDIELCADDVSLGSCDDDYDDNDHHARVFASLCG